MVWLRGAWEGLGCWFRSLGSEVRFTGQDLGLSYNDTATFDVSEHMKQDLFIGL